MFDEKLLIGIDHGNGYVKTIHSTIGAGVKSLASEPAIKRNIVKYNGKYYEVGNTKSYMQKSKCENDNYFILTLAAIAEELKFHKMHSGTLRLGVGIPLMRYSREASEFKKYLMVNGLIEFSYEGIQYTISISSVDVMPQGYSGILSKLDEMNTSTIVVDIGSWTVDILSIFNKQPIVSECCSLDMGTIIRMININEKICQTFGSELDEKIITDIMINGNCNISHDYYDLVESELLNYIGTIMDKLRAMKINTDLVDIYFIGGGASIFENFMPEKPDNIHFIIDNAINSKGYTEIIEKKYPGDICLK